MTTVKCDLTKCIWNDHGLCLSETIEFNFGDCLNYEDITDSDEYQEKFWIRTQPKKDGPITRELKRGKRLEMYGLTFYTQDNIRTEEDEETAFLTEATTGYRCGTLKKLGENIEFIKAKMADTVKNETPLMDLPIDE